MAKITLRVTKKRTHKDNKSRTLAIRKSNTIDKKKALEYIDNVVSNTKPKARKKNKNAGGKK